MPSTAVQAAQGVADRAAGVFWGWSKTRGSERGRILSDMAEVLTAEREALVHIAAQEVGAAPQWVDFNISIAQQTLLQARDLIPLLADRAVVHADARRSVVRRQAVGVVLGFVPWNAPIALAARAVAAPLACGNTVALIASEHCPKTHALLGNLFEKAGLPKHVVGVVTNDASHSLEVARALIAHPTIRRVTFTGSTRVGQIVAIEAAQHLKRCVLELSGKAPLIVLQDADIAAAAAAAMTGAFFNQGQVCISTERIIVLDAVADAFVAALIEKSRRLTAADPRVAPASLGRLITADAAMRVSGLVQDALEHGATLCLGGQTDGAVMQPTILDHVTPKMRIYGEESFGPVASVIRVRTEDEAVSVANDTAYGLAASVFGADEARCLDIADRLETGICQINGPTIFDDPTMPFGGMKASGYGRFGGTAALDEFTEIRWLSQHRALDAAQIEDMLNLGRTDA